MAGLESRDDMIARLTAMSPAYDYTIERLAIAVAPLLEEIEYLESELRKAKHLARLTQKDLKRPDDKMEAGYVLTIANKLADLTSADEVKQLIQQHGAKKLGKLKGKNLIAFGRDVQYKLSYLKAMSEKQ